jgi:hypothetical protein
MIKDVIIHYRAMSRTLLSLVPHAADLVALKVEELAGVLLIHLKSYEGVHGRPPSQRQMKVDGVASAANAGGRSTESV